MSFNNASEIEILEHVFSVAGSSGVTQGTHLALFTASPEDDADTSTNEATDFTRVQIDAPGSELFTRTDNVVENGSVVTFTNGGASPVTITHVGVVVGASGTSQIVAHAELATSREVPAGADLEFAVGAITFELD